MIYIYEFIYDIYVSFVSFLVEMCPQPNTKAMVVTRVKELLSGKTCMLNSS